MSPLEDVLKVLLSGSKVLDPSKSPLKRETLILVPPFLRGVRGDLKVPKVTAKHFMANAMQAIKQPLTFYFFENDPTYSILQV